MLHSGYCVNSDVTFWVTMSIQMLRSGLPCQFWCYILVTMSIPELHSGYCVNCDVTLLHSRLARQFWDKGKPLEKYIRWRTQLCNTLCFWTFVFRPCIWSLLLIHSVRLNAAQLGLDCILRLSHLQLSLGYPIFGYPSLSSRSVFGSCLSCLHWVFESSCCINHPGLINTLPRLTCSWSVLVVSLIRFRTA